METESNGHFTGYRITRCNRTGILAAVSSGSNNHMAALLSRVILSTGHAT
ncbi:hypothetical protein [Coprobacter fastidiosus]|nr:hypothetical protein [Coprobacter fastidiosus]